MRKLKLTKLGREWQTLKHFEEAGTRKQFHESQNKTRGEAVKSALDDIFPTHIHDLILKFDQFPEWRIDMELRCSVGQPANSKSNLKTMFSNSEKTWKSFVTFQISQSQHFLFFGLK